MFVQQGGLLTIGAGRISGNAATPGAGASGGGAGQAFGAGLFIQGNQLVSLAPGAGQTLTIGDVIADQTGSTHQASGTSADGTPLAGAGGLLIDGAGTVVLAAANTFTGGTTLDGGTLEIGASGTAGSGAIGFASNASTLRIDGAAPANPIGGFIQGGDAIDLPGLAYTSGGSATLNPLTQTLTVTEGGASIALALTGASPNEQFAVAGDAGSGTLVKVSGLIDSLSIPQQLELIYIAYFNRAADDAGLAYWSGQNTTAQGAGQSPEVALNNIANSFTPQPETIALYPFLSSTGIDLNDPTVQTGLSQFVDSVYVNLFGHLPDLPGLIYWVGQITGGTVGLGSAALAIANGAVSGDAIEVRNKLAVGLDFTTRTAADGLGGSGTLPATFLATARSVLNGVDGTALNDASATAGMNATTAYTLQPATVASVTAAPATGDPATGSLVTLTVTLSKTVAVSGGIPSLSLNDGGTAIYDPARSGGTVLVFDYTVLAGQSTAALAVTGFNANNALVLDPEGIAANLAGAAVTLTGLAVNMPGGGGAVQATLAAGQALSSAGGDNGPGGASAMGSAGGPIVISASDGMVDPGPGSTTIAFLAGATGDTVALYPGGEDQISGFDPAAGDVLDVSGLVASANLAIPDVAANLGAFFAVVDQGADAVLRFDPLGSAANTAGGAVIAVLSNLGATVTDLSALSGPGALRL